MKTVVMIILFYYFFMGAAFSAQKEQEVTARCIAKGGDASVISACIAADLTKEEIKNCLGMSDGSCVGKNNEVRKALTNAYNDLTKGPNENNDLVGRKGWLRQRLGF